MQQLLEKANIKDAQLKRLISTSVSKNLASLAEPCYFPQLKKHYYEFLKLTGVTEKDIKEFVKRRWAGKKEAKFSINTDKYSNLLVFLLQYFLSKRDKQTYNYLMVFYLIRHYANRFKLHFSPKGSSQHYCQPDVFKYALETLTKTHLFFRERTIGNALYYLSQEMIRQWSKPLQQNDIDEIGAFMRISRHRVAQSLRSFAQTYYRAHDSGAGIQSEELPDDDSDNAPPQSKEKSTKILDDIVKKVTIYRYTDRKAQEEARKISKINASLATQITSKLSNTKYSDNIRLIFKLYMKGITSTDQVCGKKYEKYVRDLMSLKRTRSKIYFKQQINVLLTGLMKDFKYSAKYKKLTPQTQFLINLFLAYYLTMLIRSSICVSR